MRTQAAALAGHRNMQMPPRYAHLALNHLRAGVQASEQRSPHQYPGSPYPQNRVCHQCHEHGRGNAYALVPPT